jgi:hypothetical protein
MGERRVACVSASAILLIVAAVAAGAAGAAQPSHVITQTSIGGATLGRTAQDYTHALGSPDFKTRMPGALTRLTFAHGELQVFLRDGRGVAILTSSDEFRTAKGVGPCVDASKLRRVYGRRLVGLKPAHHQTAVAFNVGQLAFAAPSQKVAAVLLARTPSKYVNLLLNSSSCGSGEED